MNDLEIMKKYFAREKEYIRSFSTNPLCCIAETIDIVMLHMCMSVGTVVIGVTELLKVAIAKSKSKNR